MSGPEADLSSANKTPTGRICENSKHVIKDLCDRRTGERTLSSHAARVSWENLENSTARFRLSGPGRFRLPSRDRRERPV